MIFLQGGFSLFETFLALLISGGLLGGIFSLYRSSRQLLNTQRGKNSWTLACQSLEDPFLQEYLRENKENFNENKKIINKYFWSMTPGGKPPSWGSNEISLGSYNGEEALLIHQYNQDTKGALTHEEASHLCRDHPGSLMGPGNDQQCTKNTQEPGCIVYLPLDFLKEQ